MSRFDALALKRAVDAQAAAADPGVSAWVAANAGSGKTRLLTDRVANLLLKGAAPDRILCLTYTKAAAGEMANRLFALLSRWATADDEALAAMLGEQDRAVLASARRLFARALETPGGLKIQTIHAFCEQVLRRFPLEAGAPPDFRTLEEDEAAALRAEAREAVLSGSVPEARYPGLDRAIDRVFAEIREDAADGAFDAAADAPDTAAEAFRELTGLRADETVETILNEAFAALDVDGLAAVRPALAQAGKNAAKTADAIAAMMKGLEAHDLEIAWAAWSKWALSDEGGAPKPKAGSFLAAKALGEETVAFLVTQAERTLGFEEKRRAVLRAEATDALIRVSHACRRAYERLKRRAGALDFADLVALSAKLLTSEDGAWARWRLDRGVDHVLVDEAQDNSPDQWAVISGLTQEFFADADGAARTILGVGDVKQSIFRFQGAAPQEFFKAGRDHAYRSRGLGRPFVSAPLDVSFRSADDILRAVDLVCADPDMRRALAGERRLDVDAPFETAHARAAPERKFLHPGVAHQAARLSRGRVELWPVTPAEAAASAAPFRAPLDDARRSGAAGAAETLADQIAEDIDMRIRSREALPSKAERGLDAAMRPGDVLILVGRRGALYHALIRALRRRGVPVAGQDRFIVQQSLAVKDVVAFAAALIHDDDYAFACFLRSPMVGLSEDALQDAASDRDGSLLRAVLIGENASLSKADRAAIERARDLTRTFAPRWASLGPFAFFQELLSWGAPSMRARLVGRLGAEAEDALKELLSQALAFETGGGGLAAFLIRLQSGSASVKREFDGVRDEVRVMTVHGAKGLEAPVVYLPDTTGRPAAKSRPFLSAGGGAFVWAGAKTDNDPVTRAALRAEAEAADDERARLLYVAMTRAADRLVIAGATARAAVRGGPDGKRVRAALPFYPRSWRDVVERSLKPHLDEDDARPGARTMGRPFPSAAAGAVAVADAPVAAPFRPRRVTSPTPRLHPSERRADARRRPAALADGDARRRGVAIHALLERLPALAAGDRLGVARRLLRSLAPGASDAVREAWRLEAMKVLDAPELAEIFGPTSRSEVPISARLDDGRLIVGRVDRLIVTDHHFLIVDFKTGERSTEPLGIDDVEVGQLAAYRAAFRMMIGARTIRCAILWTREPVLEHVDGATLDAAEAAWR